jgi:hypothetical protein
MAVEVVTEAPRRQRPEVMPRVKEEVVVLLGAELAAPDGRSLGRLSEVGLDHFGHLSALVGPCGAYAAAESARCRAMMQRWSSTVPSHSAAQSTGVSVGTPVADPRRDPLHRAGAACPVSP